MLAAEAARFGLTTKKNFTKQERAGWTAQEKAMWKSQVQMGGEKKASKYMREATAILGLGRAARLANLGSIAAAGKYFDKKNGTAEAAKPPKPAAPSVLAAALTQEEPKEQLPPAPPGQLACAGSLDWITVGGSATADEQTNLYRLHRIATPAQVRVVASGPSARHVIAIDTQGRAWSWGRNCSGQLGHGDEEARALPARIAGVKGAEAAACGRHHTLLLAGGAVMACGKNNAGQLGIGEVGGTRSKLRKVSSSWAKGPVAGVAAGAEYSVACSAAGQVASWGHPQYGQLGHGTDGEYIAKQGKVDYSYELAPKVVAFGESVECEELACGNNHTVARTREGAVYTWGFGGYSRLGHGGGANEMRPRKLVELDGTAAKSSARMIRAGAACCFAVTFKGSTLFWGKTKQTGEPTIRPTMVSDLCASLTATAQPAQRSARLTMLAAHSNGWRVRDIGAGHTHAAVAADSSLISWGPSPSYGALAYGEPDEKKGVPKSSTKPRKVDDLEGQSVCSVAAGYAHTVLVIPDEAASSLPELQEYDIAQKKETYSGPNAYMLFMKVSSPNADSAKALI